MERLSGHTALTIGDKMVVYGGKTSPTTLSGEVLAMDLASGVWNRVVTTGMIPRPRAFHSAVAYESAMITFGGMVAVGVDDVHYNMFNVAANADAIPAEVVALPAASRLRAPEELSPTTQRKLEPGSLYCLSLRHEASWTALNTIGAVPPTRCYHAATLYEGSMVIHGGYSLHTTGRPNDEELQAVYSTFSLDLNTMVWRELVTSVAVPKRWGSTAVLSGQYWIHYGGIDIVECTESSTIAVLDLHRNEWKVLVLGAGKVPSVAARSMHSAVRWGDRIVMFGGAFDLGGHATNQLCQFDLLSGALSLIPRLDGNIPSHRYGHSAVVVGTEMVVFGGTGQRRELLEDVWSMSLSTGSWRRWETSWSNSVINTVYSGAFPAVQSSVQVRPDTRERRPVALSPTTNGDQIPPRVMPTASESTPADVLGAMRDHSRLEEMRRAREEVLATRTAAARRQMQAVDDGEVPAKVDGYSYPRLDVGMRAARYSDLVRLSSDRDEQVWSHWQAELSVLQNENFRWQDQSDVEASGVANDFLQRHERMLSPNARRAILNCQNPTALNPKQQLYVSPSLAKLGLREAPIRPHHM